MKLQAKGKSTGKQKKMSETVAEMERKGWKVSYIWRGSSGKTIAYCMQKEKK